jgi:gamma-glutamylcyclotransferase (GGCT)/AIG2-like uncharacterized protein YtfP
MARLFTYGTLMTGQRRNLYLTRDGAQCLGNARTAPRYALFRPLLADYPCMVEDERRGDAVEGELWEVSEQCLESLDYVEGIPTTDLRVMCYLASLLFGGEFEGGERRRYGRVCPSSEAVPCASSVSL